MYHPECLEWGTASSAFANLKICTFLKADAAKIWSFLKADAALARKGRMLGEWYMGWISNLTHPMDWVSLCSDTLYAMLLLKKIQKSLSMMSIRDLCGFLKTFLSQGWEYLFHRIVVWINKKENVTREKFYYHRTCKQFKFY